MDNFEAELKSKNLSVSVTGNSVTVFADKDRIHQVFVNLLSNAVKYSREGGTIRINISNAGEEARISVEDNGIGIPADELPYIFERFYRADKSRNRLSAVRVLALLL